MIEVGYQALGMDASNFVLYGQSWGGILAMEYALAHQQNLRGLIISNMMASVPAYNAYAGPKEITVYPFNDHEGGDMFHQPVQLRYLRARLAETS